MNTSPATDHSRRRRFGIALAAATLLAGFGITSCSTPHDSDPSARSSPSGSWKEGAGAKEASAAMKVDVPSEATSVKGAVRLNPQEDQYLLSFVTSRDEAEQTADRLNSDTPLSNKHKGSSPGKLFNHLGLAAPDSLDKVMWTGVCPPCVDDATRSSLQWIEIYIEPLPHDQARVYLMAF